MTNNRDAEAAQTVELADEHATMQCAADFARALGSLKSGLLVTLSGQLGAGKTSFVRGVLRALGFNGAVKSPTYTIVEPYEFAGLKINHFDLYRLSDAEELELLGFRDYFGNDAVCFIEWPERVQNYLPSADIKIDLLVKSGSNVGSRQLGCTPQSAVGRQFVNDWITHG